MCVLYKRTRPVPLCRVEDGPIVCGLRVRIEYDLVPCCGHVENGLCTRNLRFRPGRTSEIHDSGATTTIGLARPPRERNWKFSNSTGDASVIQFKRLSDEFLYPFIYLFLLSLFFALATLYSATRAYIPNTDLTPTRRITLDDRRTSDRPPHGGSVQNTLILITYFLLSTGAHKVAAANPKFLGKWRGRVVAQIIIF